MRYQMTPWSNWTGRGFPKAEDAVQIRAGLPMISARRLTGQGASLRRKRLAVRVRSGRPDLPGSSNWKRHAVTNRETGIRIIYRVPIYGFV